MLGSKRKRPSQRELHQREHGGKPLFLGWLPVISCPGWTYKGPTDDSHALIILITYRFILFLRQHFTV